MPDVKTLLSVEGVGKKFCRHLKRSLWYGVQDIGAELMGSRRQNPHLRKEEFWALQDVNFHVDRGELVGLIGPNGAGKTTLLKVLSGLIKPDTGRVVVRGRIQALIALGAGFNPILTGRENVYINGAILGFTRRQMDAMMDEIIDFSEIGEFIDMPVQSYSSGMHVRLGFAVAVNLRPDLLIVDEVLAVGDAGFRRKARNKMMELLHSGISVIFVSHNMGHVSSLTSRCVYLRKGRVEAQGPSDEVTVRYLRDAMGKEGDGGSLMEGAYLSAPEDFRVLGLEPYHPEGGEEDAFRVNEAIGIRVRVEVRRPLKGLTLALALRSQGDDVPVGSCRALPVEETLEGIQTFTCEIPQPRLREGIYQIGLFAADPMGGALFKSNLAGTLVVEPDMKVIEQAGSAQGLLVLPGVWEREQA